MEDATFPRPQPHRPLSYDYSAQYFRVRNVVSPTRILLCIQILSERPICAVPEFRTIHTKEPREIFACICCGQKKNVLAIVTRYILIRPVPAGRELQCITRIIICETRSIIMYKHRAKQQTRTIKPLCTPGVGRYRGRYFREIIKTRRTLYTLHSSLNR